MVGSVFVEEMLHLALAANLLNAVGGRPRLDTPRDARRRTRGAAARRRSLELSLLPFGPRRWRCSCGSSGPQPPGAAAEGDDTTTQFYAAIGRLRHLRTLGERAVSAAIRPAGERRPLPPHRRAAGRGRRSGVRAGGAGGDRRAGRGHLPRRGLGRRGGHLPPGPGRGRALLPLRGAQGRAALPARGHPAVRAHRRGVRGGPRPASGRCAATRGRPTLGSPIRAAQEEFNETYCGILALLEGTFDGEPDMLGPAIQGMYALRAQARLAGDAERRRHDGRAHLRVGGPRATPVTVPLRRSGAQGRNHAVRCAAPTATSSPTENLPTLVGERSQDGVGHLATHPLKRVGALGLTGSPARASCSRTMPPGRSEVISRGATSAGSSATQSSTGGRPHDRHQARSSDRSIPGPNLLGPVRRPEPPAVVPDTSFRGSALPRTTRSWTS